MVAELKVLPGGRLERVLYDRVDALGRIALRSFFGASYGPLYKGDASMDKKIDEAERVVTLRAPGGPLGAVALMAGGRILSPATSCERLVFGSRVALMGQLLQVCHEDGAARWMTIGESYDKMQGIAQGSGMEVLKSREAVETLLGVARETDRYHIEALVDEPVVVVSSLPDGQEYRQHVWAWSAEQATSQLRRAA